MVEVTHDPDGSRFVAGLPSAIGVLRYSLRHAGGREVMDLYHVHVNPPQRGRGVAAVIVRHALEHARATGRSVVATCPYVAQYMARHPEYQALCLPSSDDSSGADL